MLQPILLVAFLAAQSPADPITGLWGSRQGAGLDLKYDGVKTVTGTIYITGGPSAPIASGSFDPATRALKLSGTATGPDGRPGTFQIEGTAEPDRLVLHFSMGAHSGDATLRRADGAATPEASPSPASPAPNAGTDAAPVLRRQFADASDWIVKAAEMVPADKYAYRPAKTVRTFGEIVAHVADAYNYSCGQAAGRDVQWSPAIENGPKDKATVVAQLKAATAGCGAVYERGTNVGPLVENVAHAHLHYGNLVTYMRMLGLVPPSSGGK